MSTFAKRFHVLYPLAWSLTAAFGAYFCMYGFRKPFTAADYGNEAYWGVGFKTILVTAQVLGYTLAKFIGIKVIAEMPARKRIVWFCGLIVVSQLALLFLAITPAPFNAVWLFVNGLSLGMVFGLVLGFLEGRQQTEALTAGLCVSFIVADGVVKSVGAYVLSWGVSLYWMPFVAGLVFLLPQAFFIWMLSKIPSPGAKDISSRSERLPMNSNERNRFFSRYAFGLVMIILVFIFATVMRSMRADFAPEIWHGLGVSKQPAVFAISESCVGLVILILFGSLMFIRNNRLAFFVGLGIGILGFILLGITLWCQSQGWLSPMTFMVLIGIGLYLPYIVVHTTLFERLLAMTREHGNIGYLMYLADSFGYLGYVLVMFLRNIIDPGESFLEYFTMLSWGMVVISLLLLLPAWYYFARHPLTQQHAATIE